MASSPQLQSLLLILFLFPSLSFSDPRTSTFSLFCSPNKLQTKTIIPTFVKQMSTLSNLITTTHFATFNSTTIYSLAQCHDDLSQTDCLLCFAAARTKLPRCLPSSAARIYLDGCFLRYDNYSFYRESTSPEIDSVNCGSENGSVSAESVVRNVTKIAVEKGGFGVSGESGVYALAQCWESVGVGGCRECLEKAARGVIEKCGGKTEGRALNAGCYLRFSNHKFFNHDRHSNFSHASRVGTTIAIALATIAMVTLFLFAGYAVYARLSNLKDRNEFGFIAGSTKKSYTSFKYETLEKATDYFNPSRKLGQGGAGSVYLGKLQTGETIAVKRLIYNARQWVDDFFNEVNLISRIHHKNLVKFLGCSIEGPESLLVYEYMSNKSLDQFIFDKNGTKQLNWKQRLNIIVGTAEGLMYLHEGSDVRIIHRDIKSSNILLDENLNSKIADFGLVRCFGTDKSHISTGIAGTLGYMAPEYLVRGQLTEKADVYSFGIVILEIACGRRNNAFTHHANSPLQTVWTLYRLNRLVEAIDPNLKGDFPEKEARNVLRIGLLCTQATVASRPSMSQVIRMLIDENCEIPIPSQPPFMNSGMSVSTSPCNTNSFFTKPLEVSNTSLCRFQDSDEPSHVRSF